MTNNRVKRNFHKYGFYISGTILIWKKAKEVLADFMNKNPSIYKIKSLVAWTMGQMNRRPSFWCSKYYFLFVISYKILFKNPFNLFFYFFIKIKSFECPKSIKSIKKNTWYIRLLVDISFVPLSKQPSIIYCRLTDL